jgi:hypothetical protein
MEKEIPLVFYIDEGEQWSLEIRYKNDKNQNELLLIPITKSNFEEAKVVYYQKYKELVK